MEPSRRKTRSRPISAITAAFALIAMLLVIQMWLLTATLEAYLAGHLDVARPGAIASGLLLVASVALYVFLERADRGVPTGNARHPH
jgi:hypothetical protein